MKLILAVLCICLVCLDVFAAPTEKNPGEGLNNLEDKSKSDGEKESQDHLHVSIENVEKEAQGVANGSDNDLAISNGKNDSAQQSTGDEGQSNSPTKTKDDSANPVDDKAIEGTNQDDKKNEVSLEKPTEEGGEVTTDNSANPGENKDVNGTKKDNTKEAVSITEKPEGEDGVVPPHNPVISPSQDSNNLANNGTNMDTKDKKGETNDKLTPGNAVEGDAVVALPSAPSSKAPADSVNPGGNDNNTKNETIPPSSESPGNSVDAEENKISEGTNEDDSKGELSPEKPIAGDGVVAPTTSTLPPKAPGDPASPSIKAGGNNADDTKDEGEKPVEEDPSISPPEVPANPADKGGSDEESAGDEIVPETADGGDAVVSPNPSNLPPGSPNNSANPGANTNVEEINKDSPNDKVPPGKPVEGDVVVPQPSTPPSKAPDNSANTVEIIDEGNDDSKIGEDARKKQDEGEDAVSHDPSTLPPDVPANPADSKDADADSDSLTKDESVPDEASIEAKGTSATILDSEESTEPVEGIDEDPGNSDTENGDDEILITPGDEDDDEDFHQFDDGEDEQDIFGDGQNKFVHEAQDGENINGEDTIDYGDFGNLADDKNYKFKDEETGGGHFFAFLLTAMFLTALLYLLYHNKRKVIAIVFPGTQRRTGMRHRGYNANYERLENKPEGKTYVF